MADIEKAIRLRPGDPAASFATTNSLTRAQAAEHGVQQVRQMIRDRPIWDDLETKDVALYEWAERMFAREEAQRKIYWDPSEPSPGSDAMSRICSGSEPGRIRVRSKYSDGPDKGKEMSFEDIWRCLYLSSITSAMGKSSDSWRCRRPAEGCRNLSSLAALSSVIWCCEQICVFLYLHFPSLGESPPGAYSPYVVVCWMAFRSGRSTSCRALHNAEP